MSQLGRPIAVVSLRSPSVSAVGEWMKSLVPDRRRIVIRVRNGIFGHGMPKRTIGPSMIHKSWAMV